MNETLQFLLRHGYSVLFAWVFAEQLGLPIPSIPMLLAAGALAGLGRMSFLTAGLLTLAAALTSDLVWYELGCRKGIKVLQFLCKISLEPDSCVRRTEGVFPRHGARSLLAAKFLPGLNAAAAPLAGIFRMRLSRFVLFDALGTLLWSGTFLLLGYIFSDQLERIAGRALALGSGLFVLLVGGLAAYIGRKLLLRRRFLQELRISRISPGELKRKLDAGEDVVVVDLRHSLDFEAEPEVIPGAVRMDAQELQERNDQLPRDREVVLYCT